MSIYHFQGESTVILISAFWWMCRKIPLAPRARLAINCLLGMSILQVNNFNILFSKDSVNVFLVCILVGSSQSRFRVSEVISIFSFQNFQWHNLTD